MQRPPNHTYEQETGGISSTASHAALEKALHDYTSIHIKYYFVSANITMTLQTSLPLRYTVSFFLLKHTHCLTK